MPCPRGIKAWCATAVMVLLVSCSPAAPEGTPEPPVVDQTLCRDYSPPLTVADISAMVAHTPDVEGWLGGDVGASAQLLDGRYVFAFGDTVRRSSDGAVTIVRNSFLTFGSGHACLVNRRDDGATIPDRPDGVGYWPMSMVVLPAGGAERLVVFAQRVRSSGKPGEFVNLGGAAATFSAVMGRDLQLESVVDFGPDAASRTHVTWGAASWLASDGYVYVFGTSNPEEPLVFGWALHVARALPDSLTDPSGWLYWDGENWVREPTRAGELIAPVGGPSQTLSVVEQDGRWYAVSKRDDFLGTDLIVWTAPSPTGPFTASKPLASIPSDLATGVYRYMPLAHPQLLPESGTMVVSVSRNAGDWVQLFRNPMTYRPEFLRVDLPR